MRLDLHLRLLGQPAALGDGILHDGAHVDRRHAGGGAARLHAGEVEDLRDGVGEAARLLHDHRAVARHLVALGDDAVGEVLPGRGERGQRRVELVRDAGDELELLHAQPLRAPRQHREQHEAAEEEGEDGEADGEIAAARRGDDLAEGNAAAADEEAPVRGRGVGGVAHRPAHEHRRDRLGGGIARGRGPRSAADDDVVAGDGRDVVFVGRQRARGEVADQIRERGAVERDDQTLRPKELHLALRRRAAAEQVSRSSEQRTASLRAQRNDYGGDLRDDRRAPRRVGAGAEHQPRRVEPRFTPRHRHERAGLRVEPRQRDRAAVVLRLIDGLDQRGLARVRLPLFVAAHELFGIGRRLVERVVHAHALARDVVGQPPGREVERAAPALLVRRAQVVDPADLQRRQHRQGDDENRRQQEQPRTSHLRRVYTPARGRRRLLTRFLHALQSACEALMKPLQRLPIVIVRCGKETTT